MNTMLIKTFLVFLIAAFSISTFSQSYNEDRVILANYLQRMYESSPFEGARVVEDYTHRYLISVVMLSKSAYDKESDMFRVAKVKALREASEFVNGGFQSSETIINTTETGGTTKVTVTTIDKMRSVGFVQGMELMRNFTARDDTEMVFIYIRLVESLPKASKAKPDKKSNRRKWQCYSCIKGEPLKL